MSGGLRASLGCDLRDGSFRVIFQKTEVSLAHITLSPDDQSRSFLANGITLGTTSAGIWLQEGSYPQVLYVPRADIDMALLEKTDRVTHCPHKGACSYYSVKTPGGLVENALWSYEEPMSQVAAIAGYFGHYPNKVSLT